MKKVLILLCFVIYVLEVQATRYYVSSTVGDDTNDGMSMTKPWKTLSKVNKTIFSPGDSILFKCGDVWRETLQIPSSGTPIDYIVFTSYDLGDKPMILGSSNVISWSNEGGNIWKSLVMVSDPYNGNNGELFFEEIDSTITWGHPMKQDTMYLDMEYDWTWDSSYVYVYSVSDPSLKYASIEVPQRDMCISLNDKQYIIIDGLEMRYAKYSGIDFQGTYPNLARTGLIVKNNQLSYFGTKNGTGYGINVAYSEMLIKGNIIHDCGRRSISIYNYGNITVQSIIVEDNTLFNGFHTTGVDISVGLYRTGHINNVILRNNLIYDDPDKNISSPDGYSSQFIFLQSYYYFSSTLKNIYVYNNILRNTSFFGIMLENTEGAYIYNNTFYGHNVNKVGNTIHVWITESAKNTTIKNNIFYTDLPYDLNGSGIAISCQANSSEVDADYNLYYRVADNLRLAIVEGTYLYRSSESWSDFRNTFGWEMNSPEPADPLFVSNTDYHLLQGSPAISSGIAIDEVVTDFEGLYYGTPANIGCYATVTGGTNPEYKNSTVEDSSPELIDIIYDLPLADVVPPISAFQVVVNDNEKKIDTVSVSGNKVKLLLSEVVGVGEEIKFSYLKPLSSDSSLQSISGLEAESVYLQPVVNNVNNDSLVVGTENYLINRKILIYPNPSDGKFKLDFQEVCPDKVFISIINSYGIMVYNDVIPAYTSMQQYNLNLPLGLYFVRLISENMSFKAGKLLII